MEREGIVERVRTEQVGRRPARTVYQITADGRLELTALRDQAIRLPEFYGPDPLGVALSFAIDGMDREELRDALCRRRGRLAISAEELAAERERLLAKGYLSVFQAAIMLRGVMHIETEVRWHDELDALLADETAAGQPSAEQAASDGGNRLE
jgi:DNA-binding PadR family transcriptional regulator